VYRTREHSVDHDSLVLPARANTKNSFPSSCFYYFLSAVFY